jgi:intein/homing endonuclease
MKRFIIKRDRTTEDYDINKIKAALNKAFINTNVENPMIDDIINHINNELLSIENNTYDIEDIQDLVEKTLMLFKYFDTAKHYINYRTEHNKHRDNCSYLSKLPDNIITPWGMLGYITYKRTYARRLNEKDENDETTEEFRDTIIRVLYGCQKQLKVNFTNNELERAYKYMMKLKFSVAGRFLWQLGTETIDKLGLMSLQNCAFVKIDEPIKPFLWIFDVLMLGTGVGFNIQYENINKLPPVLDVDITVTRHDTKDADFIVPDSREGWVFLLEKMLEAYFYKGESFTYSTILIRSAGTKIKGFGGVASGPEDLVKGLNSIQGILNKRKGQKLTSIDCLDIVNIIASVVVAGNVRRCIPAGAKVHTKEGLINIEEVIVGDEVLTTKGYKKVLNNFVQGKQEVFIVKTLYGDFKGTHNHRMMVYNKDNENNQDNENNYKWKTIGELEKGDKLIFTKTKIEGNPNIKLPSFTSFNRLDRIITPVFSNDIAWLFGYISGNCFYNEEVKAIILNVHSHELLKKISKILESFGNSLRIITDIDINYNKFQLKIISSHFYNYINTHFTGQIPYFINETTFTNRMSFIMGLFESNSCSVFNDYIKLDGFLCDTYTKDLSVLLYSCGIENRPGEKMIIIDDSVSLAFMANQQFYSKSMPTALHNYPIYKINNTPIGLATVDDIQSYSYCDTYDIEVDEVHEFFCDGFLTHNSALICMGDCDDIEYLNAKRWDKGNIPNWRCMSNNSVVCNDFSKLPDEFWEGYNGNGEPYGLVNIELSRKIGRIIDGYEKYPDPSVDGFNPCFAGETLIAVADGRGAIPIKQLAEEGKDIPVYSVNEDGIVEIKMGRHPRKTGINQQLVKVNLDNNTYVKTTLNHKFRLNDGRIIEAKDLEKGMSLTRLTKTHTKIKGGDNTTYIAVNTDTLNPGRGKYYEHRLIARFNNPEKFDKLYNSKVKNGFIKGNVVVHHKDYNGFNNCPDNLEIMTFEEHSKLNGENDQCGENNGMFGKQHNEDTKKLIGEKAKERCKNHEYLKRISQNSKKWCEENKEKAVNIMLNCQQKGYNKWCEEMKSKTNLETFLHEGILSVNKTCEHCKKEFILPFIKREIAYCSLLCSNKSVEAIRKRTETKNKNWTEKQKETRHKQIMVYKDLQEVLKRDPLKKEWENECKIKEIPFRLRAANEKNVNEYSFRSFAQLKSVAADYNHRVKSIEFIEIPEDVYNITVDDNHTIGIFTDFKNFAGSGIFTPNCGEQSISNLEVCCLSELFLPNIENFEEFKDVATIAYRICKHSLMLKCHHKGTENIVHKNYRIGIGITGYLQASQEQKNWLNDIYEHLREYDIIYSQKHNTPTSVKITTVKPSGTLSLLAGVTPGAHPGIYQYFIRRIRISSSNTALINLAKSHHYHVEYQKNFDGTDDMNTMIIEFPCSYPIGTILAKDMTAIQQLETIKELQTNWSDNAVSVTIYYRLEELDAIKQWMRKNYNHSVKSCSFLLHNEHGFKQAPYEEITKEHYDELMKKVIPITSGKIGVMKDSELQSDCVGGACPIR